MPNHSIWDDTTNPPAWRAATAADVGSGTSAVIPPGGGDPVALPLTVTVAGTAQTVILDGVSLPRTFFYDIGASTTVLTEVQGASGGAWFPANFGSAGVISADEMHTLDSPVYAVRFTRASGSNSSTVVIK